MHTFDQENKSFFQIQHASFDISLARTVLQGVAEMSGSCTTSPRLLDSCASVVDGIVCAMSGRFPTVSFSFSASGISQKLWKVSCNPQAMGEGNWINVYLSSFRGMILWDILHSSSKSPVRLSSSSQGISELSFNSSFTFISLHFTLHMPTLCCLG